MQTQCSAHFQHNNTLPKSVCKGPRLTEAEDKLITEACNGLDPVCVMTDRTIDGRCNNLLHPLWGAANTGMKRIFPPQYDDGLSSPRGSGTGQLPSPRAVADKISKLNVNSSKLTEMFTGFGQFLTHDIRKCLNKPYKSKSTETHLYLISMKLSIHIIYSLSVKSKCLCSLINLHLFNYLQYPSLTPMSTDVNCCSNPAQAGCFPISVPETDSHFHGQACLEFQRSVAFCETVGTQR